MVTLDVRLGYRDDTVGEWTELAHSFEQRKLNCNLNISKVPDAKPARPSGLPEPPPMSRCAASRRWTTRAAATTATCCPSWRSAAWPTNTTFSTSASPSTSARRSTWGSEKSRTCDWW